MTLPELRSLLHSPSWSKDVVVWLGSRETLDGEIQGLNQVPLDLLDLFPDTESLPSPRDERAELLRERLDQHLQTIKPTHTERTVLRVRNAPLLARYGVGLGPFYDWFAGSRTMTILEIDRLKPIRLPNSVSDSIQFDSDWMVNYFRPLLHRPDNLCFEA